MSLLEQVCSDGSNYQFELGVICDIVNMGNLIEVYYGDLESYTSSYLRIYSER